MKDEALRVLAIHGAGAPRRRGGAVYWKPLLQSSLGPGFAVEAPTMPEPDDPHHEAWAGCIAKLLSASEPPLLVGHSFGASTLLKFLAQSEPRPAFLGLFLVAAPFWGRDFPEYALTKDELRQLATLTPLFFYQSEDDPVVEVSHFEKYRQALPHATFRLLKDRGHEFDQRDFPELGEDIRSVIA
jgi:uncharacterized protein